jgi:hypothetical protein
LNYNRLAITKAVMCLLAGGSKCVKAFNGMDGIVR